MYVCMMTGGRGRMRRGWHAFRIAPTVQVRQPNDPMTWQQKMDVLFLIASLGLPDK